MIMKTPNNDSLIHIFRTQYYVSLTLFRSSIYYERPINHG